ncbi:MAG: UDP-N-acetylmuramoyl-L-alanyl-D-glutamate--2,6-diaminopimelate ligase [Candidatus Omnitrophota bacterium]
MRLIELIDKIIPLRDTGNFTEIEIHSLVADSRKVVPGALFVCLDGEKEDGHAFIDDAVKKGASAIVVSHVSSRFSQYSNTIFLIHENPKKILPDLLNRFYQHPSMRLSLMGVTGTNGKTTTTYLIESIYREAGKSCGVIGTVNYRFGGKVFSARNTTPGLADIIFYLDDMIKAGVGACVMEVSSHALVQQRIQGLVFEQAIFSNLTSDHLDYHHTREEYFLAKSKFFDGSNNVKRSIINVDDPYGRRLVGMSAAPVLTYAIDENADIRARNINMELSGSEFELATPKGTIAIRTPLIGRHNIYNILAAVSSCFEKGFSPEEIRKGVESLAVVPGRLERVEEAKDFFVFVDYAHTEDALKNVLESIRGIGRHRILVLFGCGGDRDKTKRPKMASVVEKYADFAIIANDNPRTEDPDAIVGEILQGFTHDRYKVIQDRYEAVRFILEMARPGDCVLIAGKGHEDYQIFKDKTIHFDDREAAKQFFKK